MSKRFKLFVTLLVTIFTFSMLGTTASAESYDLKKIKDGDYKIDIEALHATKNEASSMGDYINNKATLNILNGNATLTITILNQNLVTGFQIETKNAENKAINIDENTRVETYKITSINNTLNAQVQYEAPYVVNGVTKTHKGDTSLRLSLEGLDNLPVKEEKPEETEEPADKEEPEAEKPVDSAKPSNDSALIKNADKTFEVNFQSESSSVNRSFNNPATLLHKDGKKYIQITGTSGNFIQSLKVNGTEVTRSKVNDDGTYTMQFEIKAPLDSKLDFYMAISVPGRPLMEHTVDLSFDESSMVETTKEDPADKPEPKPEAKPEPKPKPEAKPKPEKKPVKDTTLIPDKVFEIDYAIKQEDGVKDSNANTFFTGKGTLIEKDGKTYVQLTISNGDMVKELSNKYGDALIIKNNKDGSVVVQLRVNNDLSNILLDMHIVVPSGAIPGFAGYNQQHTALLVFDKNSKKEVSVGNHVLAGTDNANNQSGPQAGANDNGTVTPAKPAFTSGDGNSPSVAKSATPNNPQTGDTANTLFFVMLLVGSLIPLAMKFRRRFV